MNEFYGNNVFIILFFDVGEPVSSQDIINQNEKNDINIVQNLLCENVSIPLKRSASLDMSGSQEVSISFEMAHTIFNI